MIRARYTGGVLKPLDKLDLEEGELVSIIIEKRLSTGITEIVNEIRETTPKIENPIKILEELRK